MKRWKPGFRQLCWELQILAQYFHMNMLKSYVRAENIYKALKYANLKLL